MPLAIGIDLGTTFSCVAVYRNGKAEVIPNKQGNRTTPSYVAFADKQRLVGDDAKAQESVNPVNTIYDSKRLIGRNYSDSHVQEDTRRWPFKVIDDEDIPKVEVQFLGETKRLRAEQISAAILEELKATAERFLGHRVHQAVITVPAYFNDAQRQATKDAGKLIDLDVMRIINEPTAAAIAYGLDNETDGIKKNVLVFDLGGGTFDVTILTIEEGVYEVKSTNGDTHLGGEDFTNRLLDHFSKEILSSHQVDINGNKKTLGRLKKECERIKKSLSNVDEERVNLENLFGENDFVSTISRAKFEELNNDLFRKTLEPVEAALRDAKIPKTKIDVIVLVGGSTRIPKIQELLSDFFHKKQLNYQVHPDEAVALGAAIQAAKLAGDETEALQEVVLLDVTPLSLGVEVVGGKMDTIIRRNTTVPCSETKTFTTYYDDQTSVDVVVYEGERPLVKDNNQLGKFLLDGIPPQPRLKANIEVTFEVNTDGILAVTAVEKSGGKQHMINITNVRATLKPEEIEMLKKETEKYREADKMEKERVEAKIHLESLCLDLKSKLEFGNESKSFTPEKKEQLLEASKKVLEWLKENEDTTKESFMEKAREFELYKQATAQEQGQSQRTYTSNNRV